MTSLLCCNCAEKKNSFGGSSTHYLLPGGEWDPGSSVVSDRSRATNASTSSSARGQGRHRSSKSSLRSIRSLLTGGGWRGRLNRARSSFDDLDGNTNSSKGDYQPPPLMPSKTLPTIDEFKLLRTVGKGAFGKVCCFCACACTENGFQDAIY